MKHVIKKRYMPYKKPKKNGFKQKRCAPKKKRCRKKKPPKIPSQQESASTKDENSASDKSLVVS